MLLRTFHYGIHSGKPQWSYIPKIKTKKEEWRMGDKSLKMPLEWNSTKSASSLRFLLKKAFNFWWLFAFLSIMAKVMWDAAYPGNTWGFLNWFAVVASWGTWCVARFRYRDATGKLVHATGFLQDAIVHFACRTEDRSMLWLKGKRIEEMGNKDWVNSAYYIAKFWVPGQNSIPTGSALLGPNIC